MSVKRIVMCYGSLDLRRALVLIGSWFFSPFVSRRNAEKKLSEAVLAELGSGEVFSYASARGALAAVLRAAGIGKDDEVILSGFTCLAVPTAVIELGAKPIYIDISPSSLNTDSAEVIAAFGTRVRAVVLQHTMGSVVEVNEVLNAARKKGITVIEDCALSIGTREQGIPIGIKADAAIFSMELSKTISTGWGGILVVQNNNLAKKVQQHYNLLSTRKVISTTRDVWQIAFTTLFLHRWFYDLGRYAYALAFKLSLFRTSTPELEVDGKTAHDFIARLAIPQLCLATHQWRRLAQVSMVSSKYVLTLQSVLKSVGLKAVGLSSPENMPVTPRICFLVNDPKHTITWFLARGVEIGRWFDGPLSPPPSAKVFEYNPKVLPKAVKVAKEIVNLPCHCSMTAKDLNYLVNLIIKYAAEHPSDCIT